MTFWELVTAAATTAPDRVVLADDYGRSLTTRQLRDNAERVAVGLGFEPGAVVSWQLPTTIESAVLFAGWRALEPFRTQSSRSFASARSG